MKRITRYAFYLLYAAIFRFTPEDYRPYAFVFPWIRKMLVSSFVDQCGKDVRVKHNADISPFVRIGRGSELGTRCIIQSHVVIGDDVIMGPDVKIYSRNHRYEALDTPIKDQGKVQCTTSIGSDVWIGANVIILPGVCIGDHVIVGAGAVVSKDVPEFAVVAGNPARILKMRKQN